MRHCSSIALATLVLVLAPARCAPRDDGIELVGDVGQIALPATALAVTWIHRDSQGLGQLIKAYLLEVGTVAILKRSIDRRRPDGGGSAFPSGHTASAFLGATYLHKRYGWSYGAPAYAAAVFVGYSRIHSDRHWATDVLAGAAIGVGANLVFTRRRSEIIVRADADSDAVSCMISFRW